MSSFTYTDQETGLDEVFELVLAKHSAILENRREVIAEAGDYVAPDIVYKGMTETATLTSNPLPASRIDEFNNFVKNTRKYEFEIDATDVPIVGAEYVCIRRGSCQAKAIHGSRFFTFDLNLRVVRII